MAKLVSSTFLCRDKLVLVEKAVRDRCIAVDTAVAKERPVAPDVFERFEIDIAEKNFLAVMRSLGQNTAKGVGKKRSAPELKALARCRLATDVARFKADPIYDRNVNSIGDGMRALNRAPGIVLRDTELGLLRWMPADRRRIEQNMCAL